MRVFPEQFKRSDFHLHLLTFAAGVSRAAGSGPLTELHAGFPAEIPPARVATVASFVFPGEHGTVP